MALAAGSTFGSFRVVEPLGQGGMATVYKAYEPALDRYVALKVLPAELLQEPTFAERFRREARVVARLEHPNIIPIYAFDIERSVPWMAMRLIQGGTISRRLKQGRRLPLNQTLGVLRGVAVALDHAHRNGVVHRDVKPQNILLDDDVNVYLTDFGIAKIVEGSPGLTRTGIITGTPQYMAPEQATGKPVDHRADVYALGIVAYEMLTGRVPFLADTPVAVLMKHISDPIPLPPTTEVPEGVTRALLKALAKEAPERWPGAVEFVAALEQGFTGQETTTLRISPPLPVTERQHGRAAAKTAGYDTRKVRPATRRTTAALAVVAVGFLALVVAVVWVALAARSPSPTPAKTAETGEPDAGKPVAEKAPSDLEPPDDAAPAMADAPSLTPVDDVSPPSKAPSPSTSPRARAEPGRLDAGKAPPPPSPARSPGGARERVVASEPRTPPPPVDPRAEEPATAGGTSSAPPATVRSSIEDEPSTPPETPVPPTSPPADSLPEGTEVKEAVTDTSSAPIPTAIPEPAPPPGHALFFGRKLDLEAQRIGPITLLWVQFRMKKQELQAQVELHCAEGKDQRVTLRLELFDPSGATLTELSGSWEVDEDDNSKFTLKKKPVSPEMVQAMVRFRLSGDSRND